MQTGPGVGVSGADGFGVAESVEEAVAEEFGHGTEVGGRHAVEAAFFVEAAIGGEDMNVGVERSSRQRCGRR